MSKPIYYKQCKIKRENEEIHQICWILEKLAVKNGRITSKEDNSNGKVWIVEEVYEQKLEESSLMDFNKLSRSHLRSTGDSLPK